jgi:hypothetical protein
MGRDLAPNELFRQARRRIPSPSGAPRPMSRQELAEAVNTYLWRQHRISENLSAEDVGRIERGQTRWPRKWRRVGCRAVLGATCDTDLGFYFHRTTPARAEPAGEVGAGYEPGEWSSGGELLAPVRQTVVARSWSQRCAPPQLAPAEIRARVHHAHEAYQRADYTTASTLLPVTITAAEQLTHQGSAGQRQAHRLLALAHIAASKLAAKLGDSALALVTADRAGCSALLAQDGTLAAAAACQTGRALLQMPGRIGEAAQAIAAAREDLLRGGGTADPVNLSLRGALALLAAIAAARQADRAGARQHLDSATGLACELGRDGNHLWTGFGPVNCQIHKVGVAVALGDRRQALSVGERLDTTTLPPPLLSRRAQVHIDLAAALAYTADGDAAAVLHLLAVERIAPQLVGVSSSCRAVLGQLIGRERRAATPQLRRLAHRAGILR